MSITYDLIARRNKMSNRPNVLLYSSDDREEVIRYMKKYDREHGFTVDDRDGKTPIGTLLLRERKLTGEILSETPWHEIFDTYGERIGEKEAGICTS